MKTSRRNFIGNTFIGGASALIATTVGQPLWAAQQKAAEPAKPKEEADEDVSANEDLMREHGVLNRILLIYDEGLRRIQAKEKFDLDIIGKSAGLITRFIEDYHEKIEENHIFPRFEQAGKMVELTVNLRAQHAMGRRVTERIAASVKSKDLPAMSTALAAFVRMYRPHEAREDKFSPLFFLVAMAVGWFAGSGNAHELGRGTGPSGGFPVCDCVAGGGSLGGLRRRGWR